MLGGIAAAVAILLFVTAHEAGHFLAAKATGMKATEFFFGFGPKIWSTRRGETEYGVKALPLGGYVRIIGMNPLEEVRQPKKKADRRVPFLTRKEFALLNTLIKNTGRVATRQNLLDDVWGYSYFGDTRTLDVHIRRLRQKLGVCGTCIETVVGVGYRFVGF